MNPESKLAAVLREANLTLSVAESCTGGGLGHLLTDIPGASAFFVGGIIAYHNSIKTSLLGVREQMLIESGAVSAQTAAAMASGCRERFRTDWSISITGIAGPGGGTDEKPIGLVFIGVSGAHASRVEEFHFLGDRSRIREQAVTNAIGLLLSVVRNET